MNETTNKKTGRPARLLTVMGEEASIKDWSEAYGIGIKTIQKRLDRGWSDEKAVTTPAKERKTGKANKDAKKISTFKKLLKKVNEGKHKEKKEETKEVETEDINEWGSWLS